MKIKLKRDTLVRHQSGTVLEVSDAEARRLIALGNAESVAEEEPKPKTTRTRKPRQ